MIETTKDNVNVFHKTLGYVYVKVIYGLFIRKLYQSMN
jgi:hypothetical protein